MDIGPEINWERLRFARHLLRHSFKYIEVPWLVSEKAIRSTFSGIITPTMKDLYTVGSAEQSFVQLQLDGKLPIGRYMSMTPCFRDEALLDKLHQQHFMKLELYVTENINEKTFNELVKLAQLVSLCLADENHDYTMDDIMIIKNGGNRDIEINGIEVGSYGIREYEGTTWIYGTGCAEPRFTLALENKNE